MKEKTKILIAALTLIIMLPLILIPASANSRAPFWEGTDSNGVVFREGDIPIEVESELLTFDIPTLPYASYRSGEYFLEYDSKVTAEYTFYNPTDMTITATLLFPFGVRPEYAYLTDSEGNSLAEAELSKYDVTVNGQPIEKTVRHTFKSYSTEMFDTDKHLATLSDEYLVNERFSPDTVVTKYTYTVSGIEDKYLRTGTAKEYVRAELLFEPSKEESVFLRDQSNISITYDKNVNRLMSIRPESNGESFTFYIVGEPLPNPISTNIYYYTEYGRASSEIKGKIESTNEVMTLEDFLLSNYKEDSGVSRVDWYNAGVTELSSSSMFISWFRGFPNLIRWYQYEITIGPGERITNSVTAPIYPDIDNFHNPTQYHYSYLLSPASGWADFGNLDIVINTDYEMKDSNLSGFEKVDGGYKLTRQGLPTNEDGDFIDLTFSLENDGNTPLNQPHPNKILGFFENVGKAIGNIFLIIFVVIVSLVNAVVEFFTGK